MVFYTRKASRLLRGHELHRKNESSKYNSPTSLITKSKFIYGLAILTVFCAFPFLGMIEVYDKSDNFYPSYGDRRRRAEVMPPTGEPSHIRMCRHLLPRFEHALAIDAAEKKAEALGLVGLNLENIPELRMPDPIDMDYLLVEEDENVCTDSITTTNAFFQIFSSALLSIASKNFKLNIEYQHNCRQWRKDEDELNIQMMLPEDLYANDASGKIPLEVQSIKNICMGCLTEVEANNGTVSKRNCALFTRLTVYNPFLLTGKKQQRKRKSRGKYNVGKDDKIEDTEPSAVKIDTKVVELESTTEEVQQSRRLSVAEAPKLPTGIVAILPVIKENLQRAAQRWIEDESVKNLENKFNRPGTLVGPSMKSTDDGSGVVSKAAIGEESAYSKVTDDDAVIYITCKTEDCSDEMFGEALAMPYYIFASEIPRSVSTITVMASKDCVENVEGCDVYSIAVTGFLTQFYPRAKVQYITESSSYNAISRMVAADYLVCPPGVACMIPALASNGRSTIIGNPNLIFWLDQLPIAQIWNLKLLPMTQVPVQSIADLDYSMFLRKIPPGKIGLCRHLRGRLGHWFQVDSEEAATQQYSSALRHYVGEADLRFAPTEKMPFRNPTTFAWKEEIFPTCGVRKLDLEGLCFAMAEIDMDRIFIIGDSFSMNQAQSLWKLLGNEDNPNRLGVRDPNWDRMIDCPNEDRTITISYARNDQLIETKEPCDIEKDLRNCYAYCYPWTKRYLDFQGTSLLIVNTGAHYQTHHQFQYAVRQFIKTVDSLNRVWDIMLFRTTTPGHKDCQNIDTTPFESYSEYAPTVTDAYSWDKFIGYNDYVSKLLNDREREDLRGYNPSKHAVDADLEQDLPTPSRILIESLDVYPSTVLRRDGHVSGEVCQGCQSESINDCMHYNLPGPPDWWNHLLYSYILDVARRT